MPSNARGFWVKSSFIVAGLKYLKMAKVIFKYPLENKDFQSVEMPRGAQVLCIQNQSESLFIWALVDIGAKPIKRFFEIFGTGQEMSDCINRKYIGTYPLCKGALVFHCFEINGK